MLIKRDLSSEKAQFQERATADNLLSTKSTFWKPNSIRPLDG